MNESSKMTQLALCRPLNDPVGFWAKLVPWLIILQMVVLIMSVFIAVVHSGGEIDPTALGVLLAILLLILGTGWLMVRPMRQQACKAKVIFLRSFAQDRSKDGDKILRRTLQSALPSDLALGGIRPPDMRAGSFFRILGEGFVAMRYLGSNQFQLEAADRNWYARLLASLSQSRAVIIDLRFLTEFVHDEIRLIHSLGLNQKRFFLLGDESQDEEGWRDKFKGIVNLDCSTELSITVVRIPKEEVLQSRRFQLRLKEVFQEIPAEEIKVTDESFGLVSDKVSKADWPTPWKETPAARFALFFLPLFILPFFLPEKAAIALNLFLALVFYPFFFLAFLRLFSNAFRQSKLGIRPRPGFASLALSLAPFLLILILAALGFAGVRYATNQAQRMTAMVQLIQIKSAFEGYYFDESMLPDLPAVFSSNSPEGAKLLRILSGDASEIEDNSSQTQFLTLDNFTTEEVTSEKLLKRGFTDPFGVPYRIFLNTDYQNPFTIELNGMVHIISGHIAFCSPGKDGKFGTPDDIDTLTN